jgi:diaminohydroxyphosphoribosylaminopyrimidine deaminase/5-amino-6-(5-phosphoribosylamino)uracil reductase
VAPLRVILDSQLRTPIPARILTGAGQVLIFTVSDDASRRRALEDKGAMVERLDGANPPLASILARLADLAVNELLVEAGSTLAGALVQAGLADELLLYVAPVLLGPQARPLFDLPALTSLSQGRRFAIIDVRTLGADVRLRLRPA